MKHIYGLLALALLAGSALPAQAQFPTFGTSLVADGDEVLIGKPMSLTQGGTVFVFRRSEGTWEETAQLTGSISNFGDGFGTSLALDGHRLLVGAFARAPFPEAPGSAFYIFEQDDDGLWSETARIPAPEDARGFGTSVALIGDIVLIGAMAEENQTGAVYVFRRDEEGTWSQQARLRGSDVAPGNSFGRSLAFDGEWALIGAPRHGDEGGAVYVFRYDTEADAFQEIVKLTGSALEGEARFGSALALHDGTAVIGAPYADGASGTAFVFQYDKASGAWTEQARLRPLDEQANAQLGSSVALAHGAVWLGAPGAAGLEGAVHVYEQDAGTWVHRSQHHGAIPQPGNLLGTALAAMGDLVVASAPGSDYGTGRVAVFERDVATDAWREQASLFTETASRPSITGEQIRCTGGQADTFACDRVDLISFLSVPDLGGTNGVFVNDLWGWTDPETDKEYVLAGRNDGLAFVDVTDPEHPVYLGHLLRTAGSPGSLWRDAKVYKNHAFIVADGAGAHGMQVFDLTRLRAVENPPVEFTEDVHYDGIHSAHNIVVNEATGFAYTVGNSAGGETCGGGLHMINIQDPLNPTFAGCFAHAGTGNNGTGGTHDAQCVTYHGPDADYQGKEICFSSNETALSIADVTDKDDPHAVAKATYPNIAYAHQGWLSDDHRHFYMNDEGDEMTGVVTGTRTLIWDVADLDDPQLAAEYVSDSKAVDHNLYIKGNLMYQSNYVSGLRIFDITDPANPVPVGYFDTVPGEDTAVFNGSWSNYPYFESGVIAVSSMREGLFILKKQDVDL